MDSIKLFSTLESEGFATNIALMATFYHVLNKIMRPTGREIICNNNLYEKRLKEEFTASFWETEGTESFQVALELGKLVGKYEMSHLDIGGTKPRTFKELLKEKKVLTSK